jgi:hypothetical protein
MRADLPVRANDPQPNFTPLCASVCARKLYLGLVAVLVLVELFLVPFEVNYSNGLSIWQGYGLPWSAPAPELPGQSSIQYGIVVAEVFGTLAVACLVFPRGRAATS